MIDRRAACTINRHRAGTRAGVANFETREIQSDIVRGDDHRQIEVFGQVITPGLIQFVVTEGAVQLGLGRVTAWQMLAWIDLHQGFHARHRVAGSIQRTFADIRRSGVGRRQLALSEYGRRMMQSSQKNNN